MSTDCLRKKNCCAHKLFTNEKLLCPQTVHEWKIVMSTSCSRMKNCYVNKLLMNEKLLCPQTVHEWKIVMPTNCSWMKNCYVLCGARGLSIKFPLVFYYMRFIGREKGTCSDFSFPEYIANFSHKTSLSLYNCTGSVSNAFTIRISLAFSYEISEITYCLLYWLIGLFLYLLQQNSQILKKVRIKRKRLKNSKIYDEGKFFFTWLNVSKCKCSEIIHTWAVHNN
jgi:hypothetical protein